MADKAVDEIRKAIRGASSSERIDITSIDNNGIMIMPMTSEITVLKARIDVFTTITTRPGVGRIIKPDDTPVSGSPVDLGGLWTLRWEAASLVTGDNQRLIVEDPDNPADSDELTLNIEEP